ncbi:cardiolipin synthase [Haploplasma axanthum]|uniref:Cardiolipin synthase n=1 Tax=Haploplasma axanthum TaxID=29552 RepID=A0A449BF49_HAPAX|nr:cardiolipin synthase [Haploplasma axanthum]VEU81062.1 Cardiolipin synthase [Haploplasma axanthum]
MRKLVKMLTSKTLIIGLIFLVQMIFLFFIVYKLSINNYIGLYVQLFFIIMAFLTVIHILSNDDNPIYKMAWLIPVLALPVFGTFFYILYHGNNITQRTMRKYNQIIKDRASLLIEQPNYSNLKEINFFNRNGWRDYKNTSSLFLGSGEEKLKNLLWDLENAQEFILFEYFIISKGKMFDQILNILIDKASNGVEVKVLYDDFGCAGRLPSNFIKKMKKKNIEVIAFNRMRWHINFGMNYRDHRKIVVIDNKVGYTGGINIADEYINEYKRFGHWHDASVRIEGDAVWSLTLTFLENWNFSLKETEQVQYTKYYRKHKVEADGIVLPFADSPIEKSNLTRDLYLYLINSAKKEILITSPYLIFDNELFTALKLAAHSGIDVKIIIPNIADKKLVYLVTESYAEELSQSGIKIYKYTPGFIHSKLLVIDHEKAVIGTTNLDFRSLYLHFEDNIYLYKSKTVESIRRFILNTLELSAFQTPDDLRKKSFILRIIQLIIKGFAPIL